MAKVKCESCGKKLEKSWKVCPECGAVRPEPKPKKKPKQIGKFRAILGVLLLVIISFAILAGLDDPRYGPPPPQYHQQVKTEPTRDSNIWIVKDGYLASFSEDLLDRAIDYSTQNDLQALQSLIDSGMVFAMRPGMEVYLEDASFLGGKIKIRPKGSNMVIVTVREAIKKMRPTVINRPAPIFRLQSDYCPVVPSLFRFFPDFVIQL